MRIRFQQTQMMLLNATTEIERHELNIHKLAGRGGFHIPEQQLEEIMIFRSREFDVDRYASQLGEALKALKLPWPEEVVSSILKRTVRSVLPNASQKDLAAHDAEIEATIKKIYPDLISNLVGQVAPSTTDPSTQSTENLI